MARSKCMWYLNNQQTRVFWSKYFERSYFQGSSIPKWYSNGITSGTSQLGSRLFYNQRQWNNWRVSKKYKPRTNVWKLLSLLGNCKRVFMKLLIGMSTGHCLSKKYKGSLTCSYDRNCRSYFKSLGWIR